MVPPQLPVLCPALDSLALRPQADRPFPAAVDLANLVTETLVYLRRLLIGAQGGFCKDQCVSARFRDDGAQAPFAVKIFDSAKMNHRQFLSAIGGRPELALPQPRGGTEGRGFPLPEAHDRRLRLSASLQVVTGRGRCNPADLKVFFGVGYARNLGREPTGYFQGRKSRRRLRRMASISALRHVTEIESGSG